MSKEIFSLLINAAVLGFIIYGFVSVGGKLSTFGIIINSLAVVAVLFSTYSNIKNLRKGNSKK